MEIADDDFSKFHTELSLALKILKYSKDKKRLREIISEDAAFRSVSKKTADLVNIVTNANLHYDNREERVDMCEAIEGIRNDARAEGRAEGKAEGKAEGMEIGFLKALVSLVKDGILTITDTAKRAGMTVAEFENKTKLLEQ